VTTCVWCEARFAWQITVLDAIPGRAARTEDLLSTTSGVARDRRRSLSPATSAALARVPDAPAG
jgi:hypothetical protein